MNRIYIQEYTLQELLRIDKANPDAVKFYKGHYYEFSNFTPGEPIEDEFTLLYDTVEAFYQASKLPTAIDRLAFTTMTPQQAKKASKSIILPKDWHIRKYSVMRNGLRQKFADPKLKELLLSTGTKQIVEWTAWGDVTWGMDMKTGEGANALGKLLMEKRSVLWKEIE